MKKKILVAEDDPDQRFQLCHHLKKWGYEVVCVASRREAERYLAGECPDLAILDLMMEEDDSGFVLAHRIKKCSSRIPVIIMTSVMAEKGISFDLGNPENQHWIKADCYLEKGYRMEQIKMILEKMLK
jgi:DNA-binding response OmpR family regulator